MRHKFTLGAVMGMVIGTAAYASPITFSDTEFNLANYTITPGTNSSFTTTLSQLALGNPGNALVFNLSGDSTLPAYIFNVLRGNSFLYNPAVSGAIDSVSFSLDRYTDAKGEFTLVSTSARLVAFQNATYYVAIFAGPGVESTWLTLGGSATSATFSRLDPATNTLDATMHPDFSSSGGLIQFGFMQLFNAGGSGPYSVPIPIEQRFDNYSLTINPAPEPAVIFQIAFGVAALVFIRRRSG